jgi:putative acetyltransferase
MEIRIEKPEDLEAVHNLNIVAFGRENEAKLVDRLRGIGSTFSFVAVHYSRMVGHLLFSLGGVERKCSKKLSILGLAPVAVLPNYQRQGIGTRMIRQGLKECGRSGFQAVVVLGNPDFYSRFGFIPASRKNLGCEYDVSDEAFIVLELESGALQDCSGTVKYRSDFSLCE